MRVVVNARKDVVDLRTYHRRFGRPEQASDRAVAGEPELIGVEWHDPVGPTSSGDLRQPRHLRRLFVGKEMISHDVNGVRIGQ